MAGGYSPFRYRGAGQPLSVALVKSIKYRVLVMRCETSMTVICPVRMQIHVSLPRKPASSLVPLDHAAVCRQAVSFFRAHLGPERTLCAHWIPKGPAAGVIEVAVQLIQPTDGNLFPNDDTLAERNIGIDPEQLLVTAIARLDSFDRSAQSSPRSWGSLGSVDSVVFAVPLSWEPELRTVPPGHQVDTRSVWWRGLLGGGCRGRIKTVYLHGYLPEPQHTITFNKVWSTEVAVLICCTTTPVDALNLANVLDGRLLSGWGPNRQRQMFPMRAQPVDFAAFTKHQGKLPDWMTLPLSPTPPNLSPPPALSHPEPPPPPGYQASMVPPAGSVAPAQAKSAWAVPDAVIHAHDKQHQKQKSSPEPKAVTAPTKVDPDEGLPEPHWPYTKPVWAGFAIEPVNLSGQSTVLKSLGFRAPPRQRPSDPSASSSAHKRRRR
ncbi:hypothetical protein FOZ63_003507 [Perkinsus olseni]|uniref:Uncharacterized protein n=2 Tax=Perkinsus olseni TaxID=32597 RepID=A0A7J6TFS8_PEROL|nr:hypothetical protein FOZ63_003507 [Perkinsus olseni]